MRDDAPPHLDDAKRRERREVTALLWFFWVGILVASAGELTLVVMMDRPASGGSGVDTSAIVVSTLAVALWSSAAFAYRTRLGGGGLATALLCWMLTKATMILSFALYFLAPGFHYNWALTAGFALTMIWLRPTRFLDDT